MEENETDRMNPPRNTPPRISLNGIAGALKRGASTAVEGAKRAHQAFGGSYGEKYETNLKDENGLYALPKPLIDEREAKSLETIAKRYEKMTSPSLIASAGTLLADAMPEQAKELATKAGDAVKSATSEITEQQLMAQAIKKAADGFGELEKQAAKFTVGKEHIIQAINSGKQPQKISSLEEICLLRSYDIEAAVAHEKTQHLGVALVEGGSTGAVGFWGLPANLALSMLAYFRAVQSVAMFYGYDVKEDPSELIIANDVFATCMSGGKLNNPTQDYVGKILIYTETAAIKQAAKKGWTAMAQAGGAALVLAQMRSMANGAAKKAVEKSGQKALEAGLFTKTLGQIGRKTTLKSVGKMVPFIGAGFGALFDTTQMSKVVDTADLFYRKRFILEKEERAMALAGVTQGSARLGS